MALTVEPPSVPLLPHPKSNDDRRRSSGEKTADTFRQAIARAESFFETMPPVTVAPDTEAAMAVLAPVDGAALPEVIRLYSAED